MKKIILLLLLSSSLYGNLEINSNGGIMIDFETEEILFEKNIDQFYTPASLTKLVTIFIVYQEISRDKFSLDTLVPVSPKASWKNAPQGSSLMFLEEGQKVTVQEILQGLAISSGNDAAIAISEFVSGSTKEFVNLMNSSMKELGFNNLIFSDPSGFSNSNEINLLEFALFCKILLSNYPESIPNIFSLESFTFPQASNGPASIGFITQKNRNLLVGSNPYVDGLKTGFINKSGYNFAVTGEKDNRRVIIVLSGIINPNKTIGEELRKEDGEKLLDHGLNNYINIYVENLELPTIPINSHLIKPEIPLKVYKTLPKNWDKITYDLNSNLQETLYSDTIIGKVTLEYVSASYIFPIVSAKLLP